MKRQRLINIFTAVCLLAGFLAVPYSEARGGHGGGGHGGASINRSAGRSFSGSRLIGTRLMSGWGRGRGGGRRFYANTAYGPSQDETLARAFDAKRAQNPYANVPQHVNIGDYIKDY